MAEIPGQMKLFDLIDFFGLPVLVDYHEMDSFVAWTR